MSSLYANIKAASTKVVEVPHRQHAVVVQPPQSKRKEFPFTGFIDFQGLKIDVENRKGDYRRGKDPDGHEWKCFMHAHYGEIRDTTGVDGDNLDVYVGDNHDSSLVVVIRQHRPDTGRYDEDKVMVGFDSVEEAIGAYKKQYDKPGFYQDGDYLAMPIGAFWRWVHDRQKHGKKVAAVPDVLRPALSPFTRELNPTFLKALIGTGGLGAAALGAYKARKYDKAEKVKEEETGLPSVGRAALRGGTFGALLGGGYGAFLGSTLDRDQALRTSVVASQAQDLNRLMAALRAEGRSPKEIKGIFDGLGLTPKVHSVHAVIEETKKPAPGLLAAALSTGIMGALNGVNVGLETKRRRQELVDLADAVSDEPQKSKARQLPGLNIILNPELTAAQKERALTHYGMQKAEEAPSSAAGAALRGAAGGSLTGLGTFAPIALANRMSGTGKGKQLLSLGALIGGALGTGVGLLKNKRNNEERAAWKRAKDAPGGMEAAVKDNLHEAAMWGDVLGLDERDFAEMREDLVRARKYNAYRTKTGEHVELPTNEAAVAAALQPVMAYLLALYQLYYFAHWTSNGASSYGDHQLFERLYKSVQEEFDSVAERIVGHCGQEALSSAFADALAVQQSTGNGSSSTAADRVLKVEEEFRGVVLRAYRALDEHGGLTLGLDDLLMSIASQHESNVYLLNQRTAPQIHTALRPAR